MKVRSKIAVVGASAAFGLTPAIALAAGSANPSGPPATVTTGPPATVTTGPPSSVPPTNQGTAHKPTNPGSQGTTSTQPGATATLPAKAKAYGRYCRGESKQHVSGQHGTPFSLCVSGAAKLLKNENAGTGSSTGA